MKVKFRKPLLGFDNLVEFEIVDVDVNPIFKEVNSVDDMNIGFLAISPFDIDKDFEIKLSESDIEELKIERPEDVLLLNIITLGDSLSTSTVNMRAPIVINTNNNLATQVIIPNDKYEIKAPLKLRGDR